VKGVIERAPGDFRTRRVLYIALRLVFALPPVDILCAISLYQIKTDESIPPGWYFQSSLVRSSSVRLSLIQFSLVQCIRGECSVLSVRCSVFGVLLATFDYKYNCYVIEFIQYVATAYFMHPVLYYPLYFALQYTHTIQHNTVLYFTLRSSLARYHIPLLYDHFFIPNTAEVQSELTAWSCVEFASNWMILYEYDNRMAMDQGLVFSVSRSAEYCVLRKFEVGNETQTQTEFDRETEDFKVERQTETETQITGLDLGDHQVFAAPSSLLRVSSSGIGNMTSYLSDVSSTVRHTFMPFVIRIGPVRS
jgi:hypothetical protein